MESQPDLVRLAQSGDSTAARSLVEKSYPVVYRLSLSVLDEPVQAALAAHEAGISLLENLDAYPGPESHTAWLYRITLQVCRRRLRMRRIQGMLARIWPRLRKTVEPAGPPPNAPPEESDGLIRAAAKLDEGLRLVLVLRYGHDLLPQQIGQLLDWRESSVQARLFQARQRLRSILNIHAPIDAQAGPQTEINHRLAERLIEKTADHAITDADAARLARHLKQCPRCVEVARRLEELENDLRATFHARWIAAKLPAAGVVSTALDQRRRKKTLLRSLSLGGAVLFTMLVVGLIVFLPASYPPQSAAAPTAAKIKPTEVVDAAPTEFSRSHRPVNNRALLAGIYPGKLAFTAFSGLNDHLFTFQPGTRDYLQFTAGLAEDSSPAWSPDGQRVAFLTVSGGSESNQVYLANADGNHIRALPMPDFSHYIAPAPEARVLKDPIDPLYGAPHWSPDGQWLAMAVWTNSGSQFLVIQSAATPVDSLLLPVQGIDLTYVAWSPDGSAIAYLANGERELRVWWPRLPLEAGKNPRSLNFDGSWDDVFGLAWSPDSSQLALLGGLREQDVIQVDLHLIDTSGKLLQTMPISTGILTRGPKRSSNLAWSPDGRYLAFIPVFTNSELVYGRIMLIRAGANSPMPPLAEMDWDIKSFAWSPDGQWLAYSAGYEMWVASIAAYESGEPPLARLSGSPGSDLSWQPVLKEQ